MNGAAAVRFDSKADRHAVEREWVALGRLIGERRDRRQAAAFAAGATLAAWCCGCAVRSVALVKLSDGGFRIATGALSIRDLEHEALAHLCGAEAESWLAGVAPYAPRHAHERLAAIYWALQTQEPEPTWLWVSTTAPRLIKRHGSALQALADLLARRHWRASTRDLEKLLGGVPRRL